MRKYLALTAMATLFAGCVQDDGLFLQEQDAPISISSVEINDLRMSRAGGTPLTSGELGLFITGDGLDEKYTTANFPFEYRKSEESGPGWYPSWIKPLFAGAGKQSAYAYYPYGCGFVNNESYTTNGATDLLWWKSETTLSEPTFPIDFDHALSKLTINLKKGNEVTSDIIGVTVEGTVLTATPHLFTKTWTIAQGAVSAPLSATEITTTSGMDATFSTLLIPQSTSALKITILTSSNQVFVYNHDSEHEFVQGTAYTLSLQVDEDRTYISRLSDITVNSWAEGGSLPEGGVAQPDDQALSQVIDARNLSPTALRVAMTAALNVGKTNIEVIMEEEPTNYEIDYIGSGIYGAENVANGSINLTLSGVKVIDSNSGDLSGIAKLGTVNLPDVTSIGDRSFEDCANLTTITFPSNVQYIGGYAFHGTKWFSQKTDGLIYIGTILYGYKGDVSLGDLTIKEGTTSITSYAFAEADITSVVVPNSVTSIGHHAFRGSRIENISFSEGSKLETIGDRAFTGTFLTSIEIPASVTNLGTGIFMDTPNLRKISFAEDSKLEYIGNQTFFACGSDNLLEIEIPESVTSIGDEAFHAAVITSIQIPAGVTSIGDEAFIECRILQTVTVLANQVVSLGENVFENTPSLTSIYVPADLVDDYQAAAGWSEYADKIKAIGN